MVVPTTRLKRMKVRAKRTANKVGPMAGDARVMTAQRIENARIWAAPRLDRAAHSVEERLAPRVSAFLSNAARRVAPASTRTRRRWPLFALVSGLALGAVGLMMYRSNQQWADSVKETTADAGRWVSHKKNHAADRMGSSGSEARDKINERVQERS
jgi:hypothetical protein